MEQVIKDFSLYIDYLVIANDVDPDYPYLHMYALQNKLSEEQECFLCFMFSIVDNATLTIEFYEKLGGWPVSNKMFREFCNWWSKNTKKFKYGKERLRNFGNTLKHLRLYLDEFTNTGQLHSFSQMFEQCKNSDLERYEFISEYLSSIPYFGTLTKYDFLELLQRSLSLPIIPTTLATVGAGCFGPMHATVVVLNAVDDDQFGIYIRPPNKKSNEPVALKLLGYPTVDPTSGKNGYSMFLEEQSRYIRDSVAKVRVGCGNDASLIESCLCKYQKFLESRYYVGWEIDEQLGEIFDYHINFGNEFNIKRSLELREQCFLTPFRHEARYGNDEELMVGYRKIKPKHLYIHFKEVADGLFDDILFSDDAVLKLMEEEPIRRYFIMDHCEK